MALSRFDFGWLPVLHVFVLFMKLQEMTALQHVYLQRLLADCQLRGNTITHQYNSAWSCLLKKFATQPHVSAA